MKTVEYQNNIQEDFARYGVCRLRYNLKDTNDLLKFVENQTELLPKIKNAVETAVQNKVNVLVFVNKSQPCSYFDNQSHLLY